ncbi:MAG: phytanoyl-CoA dioxygenase family protein [Candidatus Acidiferrales bacterium]
MSTPVPGLAVNQTADAHPAAAAIQALAQDVQLTAAQIQLLNTQGFLTLNPITTPEEAGEIRNALQELFDKRAGENEGANHDFVAGDHPEAPKTAPQIINPVNYYPRLRKTACFKNSLKLAKQILGEEARCFFDLTILKAPQVGAPTPWHQDLAFRDPRFEYTEMNMWVALQDVTPESGCLRYVPGSHTNPVLPHHSLNDDPTSQVFECVGQFDESKVVACPLPAGAGVIHLPGTLHSAGPNLSASSRVAYIMVFGVPPKLAKQPQSFPWLDLKETPAQARKRRWMRRGGAFITVWRRLRRGDLTSWQSAVYGAKRLARILRRGA